MVRGTVADPAGARVPHARVVLASPLSVVASTETSANGEFLFDRVAPGRYELRVAVDGFRADPLVVVAAAGEEKRVAFDLHVSALTESVVVSASQVELPLARAADSVTVISGRELQAAQIETVADALRFVPGLTVSRNGGRGAVTSLFPRGGESDYTLVMVDGIKANAFGGGYDFSTLSANQVERIEVVRGPESALFGADAIGAVVHVVTKHAGSPRVEGLVEGGSFGTSRVRPPGRGDPTAPGAGAARPNARRATDTPGSRPPPASGFRTTTSCRTTRGSRRAGAGPVALTSAGRCATCLAIAASRARTARTRLARTPRSTGSRAASPVRSRLAAGGRSRSRPAVTPCTRPSARTTWIFRATSRAAYGLSASTSSRVTVRSQTDADLTASLALSAGIEVLRERATSTFITADQTGPLPIRRSVAGLFAEARYQPLSPLTLTAGLRVEHLVRDAMPASSDYYSPRPALPEDALWSANPRLSAAFLLAGPRDGTRGWTRIHASAGTGIRAPDALEIAFTDNPALLPERSRSVEAGLDQAFLRERLVVGATAFFNRYDDLIVAVGPALADASHYRTDNISNARAQGAELSAAFRAGWGLTARASYTFLDTAILAVDSLNEAPPPFVVGDPLLRRPRHLAALDLTFVRRIADGVRPRRRSFAHARRRAHLRHVGRPVHESRVLVGRRRRIVEDRAGGRSDRPGREPVRPVLRGDVRVSGARPQRDDRGAGCCRPLTSASSTAPGWPACTTCRWRSRPAIWSASWGRTARGRPH